MWKNKGSELELHLLLLNISIPWLPINQWSYFVFTVTEESVSMRPTPPLDVSVCMVTMATHVICTTPATQPRVRTVGPASTLVKPSTCVPVSRVTMEMSVSCTTLVLMWVHTILLLVNVLCGKVMFSVVSVCLSTGPLCDRTCSNWSTSAPLPRYIPALLPDLPLQNCSTLFTWEPPPPPDLLAIGRLAFLFN